MLVSVQCHFIIVVLGVQSYVQFVLHYEVMLHNSTSSLSGFCQMNIAVIILLGHLLSVKSCDTLSPVVENCVGVCCEVSVDFSSLL